KTAEVVAKIRKEHPRAPIIASGGKTPESITKTIEAGANAIVYTPPSSSQLFSTMMDDYRAM
ncbi:MAG: dioxygenase, partial [Denitrobacterium sp.]|nr:dioxygenase [Denitrobacterium sp.]